MDKGKLVTVKKSYLKKAEALATKANEGGYRVKSMYLFGSRINGGAHKWSDLDVCLVSPNVSSEDLFDERVKFSIISHQIDDMLEVHPMSPADFNDKYNLLAREVKKTGVRVI